MAKSKNRIYLVAEDYLHFAFAKPQSKIDEDFVTNHVHHLTHLGVILKFLSLFLLNLIAFRYIALFDP